MTKIRCAIYTGRQGKTGISLNLTMLFVLNTSMLYIVLVLCHDMNLKLVLNNLRLEVAVHFVDIRGIVDSSTYL